MWRFANTSYISKVWRPICWSRIPLVRFLAKEISRWWFQAISSILRQSRPIGCIRQERSTATGENDCRPLGNERRLATIDLSLYHNYTNVLLSQCLLSVSPKNVTRSRSDKLLQPTLTLLDFATSENRERQAILLRDLKLGINHIDKDQLRRSGILSPIW